MNETDVELLMRAYRDDASGTPSKLRPGEKAAVTRLRKGGLVALEPTAKREFMLSVRGRRAAELLISVLNTIANE